LAQAATQRVANLGATIAFQSGEPQVEATDPNELLGKKLGNYLIERFLGEGGMARVYRAQHLTLQRPCALKVLKPSIVERDEEAVASFLAEARAAANLVHPHVVTIHTIGHDLGRHFIELEFINGRSLARLVEAEGPIEPTQATCLLTQIGSALAVAHEHHLVHRDIKPGNVMVSVDQLAKLADFGLAKRIVAGASEERGWLSGTPNFMAPELFQGHSADKRSDVYAMGVTYFQLLTGQLPSQSSSIPDLMRWHREGVVPDVRDVREDLPETAAHLISRCLAKNPTDRFADAVDLHRELLALYGSLRSLESLLHESLRGTGIEIEGSGNRFELIVHLPEGRKQRVVVETCTAAAISEQVVRIYSICGRACEQHYRRALELNPTFPYGAVGLEQIEGVAYFVMTNAFPRATCDPAEIRHSVLGIAERADAVEHCVSGEDTH
jgi:serine/threonine-protein kinase